MSRIREILDDANHLAASEEGDDLEARIRDTFRQRRDAINLLAKMGQLY